MAILFAGFAGLFLWAIWQGRQMQGWDGIGYAIVAMLIAAPAMLSTLVGGGIGWWRRRRRARRDNPRAPG